MIHGPDDVFDKQWPSETTRGYFPELSRCDKCGVLDDRTERVGLLENREMYWLHPECIAAFVPMQSELVQNRNRDVVGSIRSYDRGETWVPASKEHLGVFVDHEPIGPAQEPHAERRKNLAMADAARYLSKPAGAFLTVDREPAPNPPDGWLRKQIKENPPGPNPQDAEKTKASQQHWKGFVPCPKPKKDIAAPAEDSTEKSTEQS